MTDMTARLILLIVAATVCVASLTNVEQANQIRKLNDRLNKLEQNYESQVVNSDSLDPSCIYPLCGQ